MAEKLYWNFAKITYLLLITAAILSPVVSELEDNFFIQQPRNITAMEGDMVKFNCSTTNNDFIAFWIINGSEHGWSDFRLTPTYMFDLQDNSLTINSVQKGLDGTSFQCVVAQQASEIGYLTVLEQFTSSSSPSSFATTSRSDGTDRTASSTEIRSTHSEDLTKNTPHRNSLRVHVVAAISGIIVIIIIIIIIISSLCLS